jgi:hypothetical protein
MRRRLTAFVVAGVLGCASGCGTKTLILNSQSDVVRLGPNVTGKVYIWQNGTWTLSGKTKLPEGWYAGPGPIGTNP